LIYKLKDDGHTVLLLAMEYGHIKVVQYLLLECQADITLKTATGENFLDFVFDSQYRNDIIIMLLTRLRGLNNQNNNNNNTV
jgi:hypothetical protein